MSNKIVEISGVWADLNAPAWVLGLNVLRTGLIHIHQAVCTDVSKQVHLRYLRGHHKLWWWILYYLHSPEILSLQHRHNINWYNNRNNLIVQFFKWASSASDILCQIHFCLLHLTRKQSNSSIKQSILFLWILQLTSKLSLSGRRGLIHGNSQWLLLHPVCVQITEKSSFRSTVLCMCVCVFTGYEMNE